MNTATAQLKPTAAWLPEGLKGGFPDTALPKWFTEAQTSALTRYQAEGLPGVRDEQWRYTNLRALKASSLHLATPAQAALDSVIAPLTQGGQRLVFVNGVFQPSLSVQAALPQGVTLAPLREALLDAELSDGLVRENLGAAFPQQQHAFHLLNTAFAQDGYVLRISDNTELAQPIEILSLHSNGYASHSRNIIVAEKHSRCSVIERHVAIDPTATEEEHYLNNCATEIFAHPGSKVDHFKVLQESPTAFHFGNVFIKQLRDTTVNSHNIALSGKLLRNDIIVALDGEGAHSEMNGLVLGTDDMHVDNHTEVQHNVPHCTSDEYYRTVLDDQSRSVFRGRIIVAQDAQQTNADQQNNNLLLSAHAEADSKPQLEIYADDVKCSHGATVGQLDPKSMFYLQSRGINAESARALLTFAFANEVVERLPLQVIRDELTRIIAGELISDMEGIL